MSDVQITYDSLQHRTALKQSRGRTASTDCPNTGKGEEFSPTNQEYGWAAQSSGGP
jgi:hypothetical protein